jgi:protein-arginine kinase activator protein McsA
MIKRKTIKVEEEKQVIEDVICNMCGETCVTYRGRTDGEVYEVDGLSAVVCGGWGSKIIGDTVEYKWDLCEKCTMDIIEKLKIPAERICESPWMDE